MWTDKKATEWWKGPHSSTQKTDLLANLEMITLSLLKLAGAFQAHNLVPSISWIGVSSWGWRCSDWKCTRGSSHWLNWIPVPRWQMTMPFFKNITHAVFLFPHYWEVLTVARLWLCRLGRRGPWPGKTSPRGPQQKGTASVHSLNWGIPRVATPLCSAVSHRRSRREK